MSDYLDHIINNKEQFTEQKEKDINSLRKLLEKKSSSLEYKYEINLKLYHEYKKYKLDSAIHYAEKNVQIAESLDNRSLRYNADINLASVYSYSGKLLESEKILMRIDSHKLPKDLLPDFYETYMHFYSHYSVTSNQSKYYHQVEIYRDSLLSVLEHSSFLYKINIAHRCITEGNTNKALDLLNDLLDVEDIDSPEYAMITHYLGIINGIKGDAQQEKKYYTMSAIADIKNSIKENASFQRLALIYYNSGDISKAFKYTQSAIEDAVFSGVQFRTAEMSEFYSIINASYQAKEAKTNSTLKTYLMLISILTVFLILLVAYVYKQMKKLSRIKEVLSETNKKLLGLNEEINGTNDLLNQRNGQLWESNQIKEQYIAQFLDLCSTYIDKMEDHRKTLYKLGINRNYEELIKKLRSTTVVDKELDELYAHFDNTFLSLYPTFVSDFNSLLADDEQITLKAEDLLNKELRIYALLRLGITDSTKIAAFLRCSMSTIYNYRTKMRNKAAANREEFEDTVMKIGTMNRKTR
ncbi:uncharacterized protein YoxC [Dysgonomonas hofstadii]|uniref:Uncharacterized protein YoxC n=1 Tax=Dysgonomonas hofstadii TaxID=637886 RepID=A0A840CH61_9BACT|nr:DUF6377 domain-containing protein [Dysgonomonas hofstadii]MBB4035337.1 uncharacterized protein YoxC [Dysgonomonas hofstadii]